MKAKILIVDDEKSLCKILSIMFSDIASTYVAYNIKDGLELYKKHQPHVTLIDINMAGESGLQLFEQIKKYDPSALCIIITALDRWELAVEAMRKGAFDFIKKPFDNEILRERVLTCIEYKKKINRYNNINEEISSFIIHGNSPIMKDILKFVKDVSLTDSTILITGESGTGKTLLSRLIHNLSPRREHPFLSINCGCLPQMLFESELFGHIKGSFTGAIDNKRGLLEVAEGGTVLLDEIGDMPIETQGKLLKVIEEKVFWRIGSITPSKLNVRFIFATNKNLENMVKNGVFREDLYYRISVIPIHLPPLKERKEDIPLLTGYFIKMYSEKFGKEVEEITKEALEKLMEYPWPGNIRELQNVIHRAVLITKDKTIHVEDLHLSSFSQQEEEKITIPEKGINLEEVLSEMEKTYLHEALKKTGYNLTEAAKLLNITFRSIRYKVKKYNLINSQR